MSAKVTPPAKYRRKELGYFSDHADVCGVGQANLRRGPAEQHPAPTVKKSIKEYLNKNYGVFLD